MSAPPERISAPRAERLLDRIEWCLGLASAVLLFSVMIIVCTDVALRYLFNDPLSWAYDLVSMYVMVGLLYLTLAPSYAGDHHIRIDLLIRNASHRRALWLGRLQILMIFPVFALIAKLSAIEFYDAWVSNRVLSGPIPWPKWPISALVVVGAIAIMLRLILQWFTGPPRHDSAAEEV